MTGVALGSIIAIIMIHHMKNISTTVDVVQLALDKLAIPGPEKIQVQQSREARNRLMATILRS